MRRSLFLETKIENRSGHCCFCGRLIEETRVDPCRVTIETREGKAQIWYCHGGCFRRKIMGDPNLEPLHF